jgi:hypothetical protein
MPIWQTQLGPSPARLRDVLSANINFASVAKTAIANLSGVRGTLIDIGWFTTNTVTGGTMTIDITVDSETSLKVQIPLWIAAGTTVQNKYRHLMVIGNGNAVGDRGRFVCLSPFADALLVEVDVTASGGGQVEFSVGYQTPLA